MRHRASGYRNGVTETLLLFPSEFVVFVFMRPATGNCLVLIKNARGAREGERRASSVSPRDSAVSGLHEAIGAFHQDSPWLAALLHQAQ